MKEKIRIGIDFDDTIAPYLSPLLSLASKERGVFPPIKEEEITEWGRTGRRTDVIFDYFERKEVLEAQVIPEESKRAIEELERLDNVDIYIVTAVVPQLMSYRAKQVMEQLNIASDKLIMTSAKSLVDLDILIDDSPNNILNTSAKFPILIRKPWNTHLSGLLAADNLMSAVEIIKHLLYALETPTKKNGQNAFYALIGGSGSNKNAICDNLKELGFSRPLSYTTNPESKTHAFISEDEWKEKEKEGEIFESTIYGGYKYGLSSHMDLKKSSVVFPMDIAGAIALKQIADFPVFLIYVCEDKKKMLENILSKDISNAEKVSRIICLEAEKKNKLICDYAFKSNVVANEIVKIDCQ